jgi:molybdate transport system substrate-binding protein
MLKFGLTCVLWLMSVSLVSAQELLVGAAAGYKKPLESLFVDFSVQQPNTKVKRFYGNVTQVLKQAEADGRVDLVVGDEKFINKSGLTTHQRIVLGNGQLVIAYRRGVTVSQASQLQGLRVAMPDAKQAIFGQAAAEWLDKQGLSLPGMKTVSSIPQVAAYVSSGEVDAGFLNLTEALALGEKIGGYWLLNPADYTPIVIQAALLTANPDADLAALADFLASQSAQQKLRDAGL